MKTEFISHLYYYQIESVTIIKVTVVHFDFDHKIVFLGVWTKSSGEWEEVAVKMLKDLNDPALEEEIERELNMMRRLDHENIVRIYGAFSVADTGNTGKIFIFLKHEQSKSSRLL